MKLKVRQVPFAFKSVAEDGSFEGYASTFLNTDRVRDVVMPGAFTDSIKAWKAQDAMPPCLWQHQAGSPIGYTTDMAEDAKGLFVAGKLLIDDVQQAREAYALAKAKVVRGLSIGYDPVDEEYDGKTNLNKLMKVNLWEYSFATFPANTEASLTQVKSILESGEMPTIREFESLLRDVGGYSRKQSALIAKSGYANFLEERDARRDDVENMDSLCEFLKANPIQL